MLLYAPVILFLLSSFPLCEYASVYDSGNEHLDHFQVGAIMNKAAKNNLIEIFLWHVLSFLLGKYLGLELLNHKISVHLTY